MFDVGDKNNGILIACRSSQLLQVFVVGIVDVVPRVVKTSRVDAFGSIVVAAGVMMNWSLGNCSKMVFIDNGIKSMVYCYCIPCINSIPIN